MNVIFIDPNEEKDIAYYLFNILLDAVWHKMLQDQEMEFLGQAVGENISSMV